jgi:hypothetical protein
LRSVLHYIAKIACSSFFYISFHFLPSPPPNPSFCYFTFTSHMLLAMGRLNSSGAQPLTLADTAILGELLGKCFHTHHSIDAYDGLPPYKLLATWVDTITIPYFCNKCRITNEKGEVLYVVFQAPALCCCTPIFYNCTD